MRAGDVAARTGLSYRQINYWCESRYLKPERRDQGTGHWYWFPPSEVAVAVIMARLTAVGFTPKLAHDVARSDGRLTPAPGITITVSDV